MPNTRFIPDGYTSVTPYLIVNNARAAIEFYEQALGAKLVIKMDAPGGKIAHADLKLGDSHIMLADEFPEHGYSGPKKLGGTAVTLLVYVENVDMAAEIGKKAGFKERKPIATQFYGDRTIMLEDPFGHVWTLATHVEDVSEAEMTKRAAALYG